MPLTRDFKQTIRARVQREPQFRRALLREAVEAMLEDDVDTGKALLRDYINATDGFGTLEEKTNIPTKSLMRMLSPGGNPKATNLFQILGALQKQEGIHFHLAATRRIAERT
jgi:DNA-binding phage protein